MERMRLLPLVSLVAVCLLGLKGAALLVNGSTMLTGSAPASADNGGRSPYSGADALAQENLNVGQSEQQQASRPLKDNASPEVPAFEDRTAEEGAEAGAPEPPSNRDDVPAKAIRGDAVLITGATENAPGPDQDATPSETDVLNALGRRRKELDQLEQELELRENLLKAAEKKVEARIAELKEIESRITDQFKEDEAARKAEMQRLVEMYAQMKPKDAARVFNRLEPDVMERMMRLMKPGSMSAILAEMDPAVAERLTLAIAKEGEEPKLAEGGLLPKIEGQPTE